MNVSKESHIERHVLGPQVNYLGEQAYPAFSFVDVTRAGNTLYCTGVTPTRGTQDEKVWPYNLEVVSPGNFREQYDWVLGTLGRMLELAGARFPQDVVNVNVYTTDMLALNECTDVYAKYFGEAWPALTYLQVAGLWHPEQMVECNAVAVLQD
ncbi:MAG TPA: RidA family protein [Sporichthyaceae bacterium]|nr:RidA family protein [Sporichthyaceae bacterium]